MRPLVTIWASLSPYRSTPLVSHCKGRVRKLRQHPLFNLVYCGGIIVANYQRVRGETNYPSIPSFYFPYDCHLPINMLMLWVIRGDRKKPIIHTLKWVEVSLTISRNISRSFG